MTLEAILKSPTKSIVDVRAVNEFAVENVTSEFRFHLGFDIYYFKILIFRDIEPKNHK